MTLEVVGLTFSGLLLLVVGGVIMSFCYRAYRRRGNRSFLIALLGFGSITVGGLLNTVFEVGIGSPYYLTHLDFIRLQMVETGLIALGLLVLVYSIVRL